MFSSQAVDGCGPLAPHKPRRERDLFLDFDYNSSVPLSAAALDSSANYSSPYSAALAVQHARPLLLGQPLPQGVAALVLALPVFEQR